MLALESQSGRRECSFEGFRTYLIGYYLAQNTRLYSLLAGLIQQGCYELTPTCHGDPWFSCTYKYPVNDIAGLKQAADGCF